MTVLHGLLVLLAFGGFDEAIKLALFAAGIVITDGGHAPGPDLGPHSTTAR